MEVEVTAKRRQKMLLYVGSIFSSFNDFITQPLQHIPPTISHFPIMKNTYIPIAHLANCTLDSVDVFIAFVWKNVEALRIPLGQ